MGMLIRFIYSPLTAMPSCFPIHSLWRQEGTICLFNSFYYTCPSFHYGRRLFNKLVCVILSCEGQGLSPIFIMGSGFFTVPFLACFPVYTCISDFVCIANRVGSGGLFCGDHSKTLAHLLCFKFVPLDCQKCPFW